MKKEYLAPTAKRLNYYAKERICCHGSYDGQSQTCWTYNWTPHQTNNCQPKRYGGFWFFGHRFGR